MKDELLENDTERRVLVQLSVPCTVSDLRRLITLEEAQGVKNQDGKKVEDIDILGVLNELKDRGLAKDFYGVNPHALANIIQQDDEAITHETHPSDKLEIRGDDGVGTGEFIEYGGETKGEVWARRTMNFQPDAPYWIMTQKAMDHFSTPGPDVPVAHEGLAPGPVQIGL